MVLTLSMVLATPAAIAAQQGGRGGNFRKPPPRQRQTPVTQTHLPTQYGGGKFGNISGTPKRKDRTPAPTPTKKKIRAAQPATAASGTSPAEPQAPSLDVLFIDDDASDTAAPAPKSTRTRTVATVAAGAGVLVAADAAFGAPVIRFVGSYFARAFGF